MSHSGGKPHANVGDCGMRYEVRATGYPRPEQSVIGWADDIYNARAMMNSTRREPGCVAAAIFDRQENRILLVWHALLIKFDPACRDLAEHFLQDEPSLRPRADELAGEIQKCIEDWITFERDEP